MDTRKLEYVLLSDVLPSAWIDRSPLDLRKTYPYSPCFRLVPASILLRVCDWNSLWGPDANETDVEFFKDKLESLGSDVFVKI